jgi:hypothetical protein
MTKYVMTVAMAILLRNFSVLWKIIYDSVFTILDFRFSPDGAIF